MKSEPNTLLLFRRDSQVFCRRVNGGVFVNSRNYNLYLESISGIFSVAILSGWSSVKTSQCLILDKSASVGVRRLTENPAFFTS